MSVEAATAQMANTTLNEPTGTAEGASVGAGGDKPINASQNEAVIASAAEGRRLYIGNLAYATTEGELKEFFKDYLVETTSIPTNPRTTRPVGYAFVDVSTPTEAERAINELNGKTILDRKVSVQLARKPEPAAEKTTNPENAENGEGPQRRRSSTRGRGRGRGRGGRAARGGRKAGENGEATEATNGPTNVPAAVNPLTQTTNEALTGQEGEEGTITVDGKQGKSRAPREPRKQRGPPEDGVPSKTKIMVANLPYDLREEKKLLEIFADYQPTSAKIALRPIPKFMVRKLQARNEPRKGRGFGFVTLASTELQQKACEDMNGKEIEGREIAVKVAIDSPGKEDEDPNAPIGETGVDAEPSTAEGSANVNTATA
ncbi:Putative RNA recognition motif domain, nucleotide-binding alpha-beta plait domain superfamily [Septoria linicola]|uniref:RNA recognition motif domain, nucleotide-binding alpha-beta plait domain superfamily n=1 Tax=Septoria linicola TaxID=215465 RepID=A0A9Q9APE7_9PEZI|nr:putative RNA recognition motif domain, nucleotide-binding alpha-beta plait domain superfamily [Septoria linicola]USW51999.1 Putative RNA recognition motif domain, nucleotide-binding alpha-beta plait domain superfamily [Septoria linicola]